MIHREVDRLIKVYSFFFSSTAYYCIDRFNTTSVDHWCYDRDDGDCPEVTEEAIDNLVLNLGECMKVRTSGHFEEEKRLVWFFRCEALSTEGFLIACSADIHRHSVHIFPSKYPKPGALI